MEKDYIPTTLEESFEWLDKYVEGKQEFIEMDEKSALAVSHHSIGRWLRNNWKLWSGNSELYFWFISNGIKHADDMSAIILTSFWRKKNNVEISLDKQISYYKNYWSDNDFPKEEKGKY